MKSFPPDSQVGSSCCHYAGSQVGATSRWQVRNDGVYVDGRRPTEVVFADESTDVERRDFTINALVLDPIKAELRDWVVVCRICRMESSVLSKDLAARLAEDRLRVLRGIRFRAKFDLQVDPASAAAMSIDVSGLSRERIWDEWRKGLKCGRPVPGGVAVMTTINCALHPGLADLAESTIAMISQQLDAHRPSPLIGQAIILAWSAKRWSTG